MFTGIIFPSSSTVSLEIVESLNNIKDISVIGINSHDNYETKDLFQISYNDCPLIDEDELKCIEYLINIAKIHGCNFIIPTMDYSHLILSNYDDNIRLKLVENSIYCRKYYYPLKKTKVACDIFDSILCITFTIETTKEDIDKIFELVK